MGIGSKSNTNSLEGDAMISAKTQPPTAVIDVIDCGKDNKISKKPPPTPKEDDDWDWDAPEKPKIEIVKPKPKKFVIPKNTAKDEKNLVSISSG